MTDKDMVLQFLGIVLYAVFMAAALCSTDLLNDLIRKLWYKVSGKTRRREEELRTKKVKNIIIRARRELKDGM